MVSVLLFGKFKNILFVVYSMMLMIGSQWNLKVGGEVVMCVLVLLWKQSSQFYLILYEGSHLRMKLSLV